MVNKPHHDDDAHGPLTRLAVQIGRVEEQLDGLAQALVHHMKDEHDDFKEALKKVESIQASIIEIKTAARFTRWAAWAVGILAGTIVWLKDNITFK